MLTRIGVRVKPKLIFFIPDAKLTSIKALLLENGHKNVESIHAFVTAGTTRIPGRSIYKRTPLTFYPSEEMWWEGEGN